MSEIEVHKQQIHTEDDFPIVLRVFSSADEQGNVAVIAPGVGVPQYIYFKFAKFLASRGWKVITFDFRGINESTDPAVNPSEMKMSEWGRKDLEAVLQFARTEQGADQLCFIGHSGGGQIVGLAPSSVHIDSMVFLSVTLGHWRYWPGIWKWGLFLFWYLMPLLTWKRDFFPARMLGFSTIDIPSGVTRQWARWGRSRHYLFDFIDEEEKNRYDQFDIPLLSLSFDDDPRLGPKRAADEILDHFPSVDLTRRHIAPEEYSKKRIGHFGFFNNAFEPSLWEEVVEWMESG